MIVIKLDNTTHRIPDGEDGRHVERNCYCRPHVQVMSHLPEGWTEYASDGSVVLGAAIITHNSNKAGDIDIPGASDESTE